MSNRLYQGFDEVNIGTFLSLADDDLVLTTAQSCDAHRLARSMAAVIFPSNVDFIIYSPNLVSGAITIPPSLAPVSGVPPVLVGVVTVAAKLLGYLGGDANGYGYCPGDGYVYNAGAQLQFIGVAAINDRIGILIDPSNPGGGSFMVLKNGVPIGAAIPLPSIAQGWCFAATVSGDPGTFAVRANAGQTPFPTPITGCSGWWVSLPVIAQIDLATEPYMSAAGDEFPFEKFGGDINRIAQPMTISDSVHFPMWGNSAPAELGAGGLVQLQVDDPNGRYDALLADAARTVNVPIYRGKSNSAFSTFEQAYLAVLDHCEQDTRQTKQLYLRDQISRLKVPLKRALFAPNTDASVAGKARTMSLGVCRNYAPELIDAPSRTYAGHDGNLTALGRPRIAGKQVFLGTDFAMTPDNAGFVLNADPVGAFTMESTSFGGAFDPIAPDALTGSGSFGSVGNDGGSTGATSATSHAVVGTGSIAFTTQSGKGFVSGHAVTVISSATGEWMSGTVASYSGTALTVSVTACSGAATHTDWLIFGGAGVNQPTGWVCGGGYPNDPANTVFQVTGSTPNKFLKQQNQADAVYWMRHETFVVAPGASYAYSIDLSSVPLTGAATDGNGNPMIVPPARMSVAGGSLSGINGYFQSRVQFFPWDIFYIPKVGVYNGVFVNNTAQPLYLLIGFLANSFLMPAGGYLQIKSIVLNSVPSLAHNVELGGPGLTAMVKALTVTRGALDAQELNTDDTDGIDVVTGYIYGIHHDSNDTPNVDDDLQLLLSSSCSDRYNDESGEFRFSRLYAPEGVADADIDGELTRYDLANELICYPDMAENLTTRLCGCANYKPLGASDYGATTMSDTPMIVRAMLASKYQWTVTAGLALASRYRDAVNRTARVTCLDRQADGQAQIEYENALYQVARNFYVGQFFEPVGRTFKLMRTWRLTYDSPSLKVGQKLVIVGRQRQPTEELCTLIWWGK